MWLRYKGRDRFSAFCYFCNPQTKRKWTYENASELYAPDWELSFHVRIATQTILLKVVKVVQVNNATDATIARSVLLPTTHTKPIFLTLIPKSLNWAKRDWTLAVRYEYGYYNLSAFILVYSQGILLVALLAVAVWWEFANRFRVCWAVVAQWRQNDKYWGLSRLRCIARLSYVSRLQFLRVSLSKTPLMGLLWWP